MRFFALTQSNPESHWDTEYMPVNGTRYGGPPLCPECGGPIASRVWLPPYSVEVKTYGKAFGDFAFLAASKFLMSKHAAEAWTAAGLMGVREFHPVDIQSHSPRSIRAPEYFVPVIDTGVTRIDVHGTVIMPSATPPHGLCKECLSRSIDAIGKIVIDESSWDGSDIFVARGLPGQVLVTERFVEFVANAEITNASAAPAESFRWDPLRLLPTLPG